ncbi:DUF2231 domain-containing protein [Pedobacter frigoris]|uniref:DUF2231 domain-containing protein n=1 Tax=Pedobacter frigoris TaxID=2571272 RepID=UPI00293197B0|nr:DUF2231 domain-containing protein [Pedobacter frigoris]
MNQIPSMWRAELWHPMLVHFPVATLLLATIAGFLTIVIRSDNQKAFYGQLTLLLLTIGVISGWLAIYTGSFSYNVVVRDICDPKVLQEHYWWGYASVIVYSSALVIYGLSKWVIKAKPVLMLVMVFLLMLIGAGALSYCGHLGATVVYQQGGGTYKPSADCSEFVR